MNATTKVKLEDITPNLSCPLCKGYFVDATTIIECLHSFCKSCIVQHLDKSEYCPVCDVQLHTSKPLSSIRSDYMLQEIVYKLVPGLFQNEMERRRKYYKENSEASPFNQMDSGQVFNESYITSDDIICLSLERHLRNKEFREDTKRYIKCQAAVSVAILKKFIQFKFDLSPEADIELMYGERVLPDDFLLMDIAYKYSWTQNGKPLQLSYRVTGNPTLFKPLEPKPAEQVKIKKDIIVPNGHPPQGLLTIPSNPPPPSAVSQNATKIPARDTLKAKPTLTPSGNKAKAKSVATLNGDKAKGKTPATPNGAAAPSPIRGRKKKKILDTEKELNRIRASVSESSEAQDKEVQLRISENGVMSARNVASGEEKIISATKSGAPAAQENGLRPRLQNATEPPKLLPKNPMAPSIPRTITPVKTKSKQNNNTPKSLNGSMPLQKNLMVTKKPEAPHITPVRTERRPEDVKTGQQVQQGKFSSNMETLKAVTMRLKEELETKMNYFSAEITPITVNGTPPPKIAAKGTDPQHYPAATLHPSTAELHKAKNTSYNKRLHQTTIVNGDVKFTKNQLLPSPQGKGILAKGNNGSPKDKQQASHLTPPAGSPTKPPKFFKSRLNSSSLEGPSIPAAPNFNGIADTGKHPAELPEQSYPAKKAKLTEPIPTPTACSSALSGLPPPPGQQSPSAGPSRCQLPANMNFPNGIPLNLMPYVTAGYSSLPFLNNPALKNVPMFAHHPYFDFSAAAQMHSLAQTLNNNGGGPPTSSGTLSLDLSSNNVGKSTVPTPAHQNILAQPPPPVSTQLSLPKNDMENNNSSTKPACSSLPEQNKCVENKTTTTSQKLPHKINSSGNSDPLASNLLSAQNLLAGIQNTFGLSIPMANNNAAPTTSKVSRKCASPTKIPRSMSNNVTLSLPLVTTNGNDGSTENDISKSAVPTSVSSTPPITTSNSTAHESGKSAEGGASSQNTIKDMPISNCEPESNKSEEVPASPKPTESSSATEPGKDADDTGNNNEASQCNNNNVNKESISSKSPPPPPTTASPHPPSSNSNNEDQRTENSTSA